MANSEHVAKLEEGEEAWNAWRQTTEVNPDLSGLHLKGGSFGFFNLTATNFSDAHIEDVLFISTRFNECSFQGALIFGSTFHSINLKKSNFTGARILASTFTSCKFEETIFIPTQLIQTTFARGSLRAASGLDQIPNLSGNSIGIDTFFNSGGLPESFLRGCGVPDEFLQYAASLAGKAIEYYSCFLSYSSQDDVFARRLYNDLQGRKISTWWAPEDLKTGDLLRARIDESIRIHDKLVLILSAHSVASDWVETEVESALERERKEGKEVLFPIAIDDEGFTPQQPWAADIRRKRQIGDFRKWKSHDDYTTAFDRLVRDLKKSQPPIIMKGG